MDIGEALGLIETAVYRDRNNRAIEALKLVEEKFTSTNTARDAILQAYVAGYESGHHDTVESQYVDAEEKAVEWLEEQHP